MSKLDTEENLYELLRVSPRATVSEITTAYHAARNAFSTDSLAVYSLMPAEDSAKILNQLEHAYMTLTNPDKRRAYDKQLASGEPTKVEPALKHKDILAPEPELAPTAPKSPDSPIFPAELNLSRLRESKGLSVEDVSRITKIPVKYIKALEELDPKKLPAQVYIQGFLKNIAQVYRLDPKTTVTQFMERLNNLIGPSKP